MILLFYDIFLGIARVVIQCLRSGGLSLSLSRPLSLSITTFLSRRVATLLDLPGLGERIVLPSSYYTHKQNHSLTQVTWEIEFKKSEDMEK